MSDLENLPPLRDIIQQYDLRARKSLGQNFLLDMNLTDKIVRAAGNLSDVTVFEIGPGPGGLTRSLLKSDAKRIIALEYDDRAVKALRSLEEAAQGRLSIVAGNALEGDLLSLCPHGKRAIVANLPYNIATPLLIGWLKQIYAVPGAFESMTLMFQREVAERLVAPAGNKTYGRLSVLTQWLCDIRPLFTIPPSAFTPPPKVTSAVIQFVPRKLSKDTPAFESMEAITAAAFGQRRKMLRSSLKAYPGVLEHCGIETTLRAENITVADYMRMATVLASVR